MYIPFANRVTDRALLHAFMRDNDFATVISNGSDGVPQISYAPVLTDLVDDALWCSFHLARQNPHNAVLQTGVTTTLAFHGPHAFIHPGWYAEPGSVPTWNYAVVHATGTPVVIAAPDDALQMVNDLTHFYDASLPAFTHEHVGYMLQGIVCYRMRVDTLEGKYKLGQNRSLADRVGMRAQLATSNRERERELAELMQRHEPHE